MYGDLQYTNTNTGGKFKGNSKVYSIKAGPIYDSDFLVGFCGSATDVVTVLSYFLKPDMYKRAPRVGSVQGLVLTKKKEIYVFEDYTKWLTVNSAYHSIGSGSPFAMGALAQGATPKEAVKVAMQHDAFTGLGFKGYRI